MYILGYSPSSWSSLAGSLWKEKSARNTGRDGDAMAVMVVQRTAHDMSDINGLAWCRSDAECVGLRELLFYDRQMRKDPEARRAVLKLLSRGAVTPSEAAQLAGVSRQLIHAWCASSGIIATRSRQARLARLWRGVLRER